MASSFGKNPIVRCGECRAYMNPFMRFIEGGTRFICNMCGESNKVD
jgi:protein transport protein SEC24